jgi:hypothetical protein
VRPTNLSKEISTMTTATMALTELAEKGADIDVLRQMVQFMAQRLMELDVEGRCGAGYDEKNVSVASRPILPVAEVMSNIA